VLGYAFQKGLVPLGLAAIERAIELNGAAVDANKRAFTWGRVAAHDLDTVMAVARPLASTENQPSQQTLGELVDRYATELAAYQNARYAHRYRAFVMEIAAAEKARRGGLGGLTEAVARNLFKLMAYKDEYEVARLYTNGAFLEKLGREFEGPFRLEFHLAPPLLAKRDPTTGHLKKVAFGRWMFTTFKLLAALRHLRGTPFDIFGRTEERRTERRLIDDYEALVRNIAGRLTQSNHALAVELARLPEQIRGFGHVKTQNLTRAKKQEADLLTRFDRPGPLSIAAE
jgi:indolepyruvate ferredoxin oxidoreductase